MQLLVKKDPKPKPVVTASDGVQNYGHLILELGLLFQDLLDFIRLPDRDRGLRLLKLAMVFLKSNSNWSKYALEILRFLIHQQCTLSEREAAESFYGLFVNTKGRKDTHIEADRRMEHLVRESKKHLKHMQSGKSEHSTILKKSSAIAGLNDISDNYDKCTGVIVRANAPSEVSAEHDELRMLEDIRKVRPFQTQLGRSHASFPEMQRSMVDTLDMFHFHKWITDRIEKYAVELGN